MSSGEDDQLMMFRNTASDVNLAKKHGPKFNPDKYKCFETGYKVPERNSIDNTTDKMTHQQKRIQKKVNWVSIYYKAFP